MLVKEIINRGMVVEEKTKFVDNELTDKTAVKKQYILNIISLGSQLTLLATIVEQLGTKAGLKTPEFTIAKQKFAEIKTVLNSKV